MIYRDFHQTFYRSGPCTADESCCLSNNWHNDYFNLSNHKYNEETKRYEGKPFAFLHKLQYKCNSQRCLSEKTQARCIYYAGVSANAAGIVSYLNNDTLLKNEIYSPNMEEALVSLTVKEILGYNETSFEEIDRNQETTSIDISCAADDLCFTPGSLFTKAGMSSAFPFCVWSPQRQFGADFSRETIVADASNKPDRIRFEITSTFDFGDSVRFKDESDNDNSESLQKEENQKQYYPKHGAKNRNVLRHEF
uniref:Uncharacterized protein n=1 Tax=Panagrolaimus davidi TaxID=227884 RepID=A0A914PPM8_9BILA